MPYKPIDHFARLENVTIRLNRGIVVFQNRGSFGEKVWRWLWWRRHQLHILFARRTAVSFLGYGIQIRQGYAIVGVLVVLLVVLLIVVVVVVVVCNKSNNVCIFSCPNPNSVTRFVPGGADIVYVHVNRLVDINKFECMIRGCKQSISTRCLTSLTLLQLFQQRDERKIHPSARRSVALFPWLPKLSSDFHLLELLYFAMLSGATSIAAAIATTLFQRRRF